MDEKLSADILAVCNTLGYSDDESRYFPDPQCLDSAKDLVLYLRKDTEQHDVRRLLGEAQILQQDLIPIFKMKDCGEDLSEVVLRLMVNLTNPTLLLYTHGIPKNVKYRNHYMTITRHLQAYKIALVDKDFWTVIFNKLRKLMGDMDLLLENQRLTLERIILLIRNILQVPADPKEEMRNDDDASVHDQILWAFRESGIMDLILFISSSDSTREFCMHSVEIISLVFREHSGEQLAKTNTQRSESEKLNDVKELNRTRLAESLIKSRKLKSVRNFGGTFVIRGLQGPSGLEQICHKPVHSVTDLSLDNNKKTRKTPVNRRQIVEPTNARKSTLTVRLFLKEFCVEFLIQAYNNLMRIVKDRLTRSRGQENDEIYYLLAMRFFMEFNRCYKFRIELVSETMSIQSFHYVQGLVDRFHEMMLTDKDNISLWSKRAHTAFRAYQELLSSLCEMERTRESRESARVIESTILYLPEYRELCVSLLASYDAGKLSRNYLCDLVDTNHLFLKMLENFTREEKILVAGNKRIKRRRPTKKKNSNRKKKKKNSNDNSEKSWENLEEKLTEFISSSFELEQAFPFDAASDTPIDEQKGSALNRIATHISLEEFTKAVSLFRAAKEVWPDDNQLSMETEISSLKSIFLQATLLPDAVGQDGSDDEREDEDDDEEYDESNEFDEDEPMTKIHTSESEFDFRSFLEKYAVVKIVSNLGNLFKHFASLSPLTLHAILKMFHRYAFDMGYPAMLCQASIFHTFQTILQLAPIRDDLKEAAKFCQHFWAKFVELAGRNPKIFLEILFWKSSREAQEIQEGYAQYADNSSAATRIKKKLKSSRKTLSPEEENEIVVLAEEYNGLADKKDMKQVDWINDKLINGPKVKKIITNFLSEKNLLFQGKIRASKVSRKKSAPNSLPERIHRFSESESSDNEARNGLSEDEGSEPTERPANGILEHIESSDDEINSRKANSGAGAHSNSSRSRNSPSAEIISDDGEPISATPFATNNDSSDDDSIFLNALKNGKHKSNNSSPNKGSEKAPSSTSPDAEDDNEVQEPISKVGARKARIIYSDSDSE